MQLLPTVVVSAVTFWAQSMVPFVLFSFRNRDEIDFMLACCDTNHEGKIDYLEFTERFHNPAKEIGFNLAVLLTNLSEHMPNDPRWVPHESQYERQN